MLKLMSFKKIFLYIVLGLVGLGVGGKMVVQSAIVLAKNLGVSDTLIGLTIVAIGTSLPELVTSAIAAYKKKDDIALGNIVGSNIFNIFLILGVSTFVASKPLSYSLALNFDILVLLIASAVLFISVLGKKRTISRWSAAFFLLLYIGYTVWIILRDSQVERG
jgi:cation:H+ antiporter